MHSDARLRSLLSAHKRSEGVHTKCLRWKWRPKLSHTKNGEPEQLFGPLPLSHDRVVSALGAGGMGKRPIWRGDTQNWAVGSALQAASCPLLLVDAQRMTRFQQEAARGFLRSNHPSYSDGHERSGSRTAEQFIVTEYV
jgi:hypothetical protein